jgi:hypothetical protein
VFFSITNRHALRRGHFPSVTNLTAIGRFSRNWNQHYQPLA